MSGKLWSKRIVTLGAWERLPQLNTVAKESQSSHHYHWDGKHRKENPNSISFQMTLRGRGHLVWKDTQHFELPPQHGFLFVTSDPEICYHYPHDTQEPWEFFYLQFDMPPELIHDITRRLGPVHQLRPNGVVSRILQLGEHPEDLIQMKGTESAQLIQQLMAEAIDSHDSNERQTLSSTTQQALNIISQQVPLSMNAHELADKLKVSREHLSRLFKKDLGVSPYQHILNIRIHRAKSLLSHQAQLSCKEIAHQCGFDSHSNFNQVFKRCEGLSPNEYRKKNLCSYG